MSFEPARNSFDVLSPELLIKITSFLDWRSLIRLSSVNTRWRAFIQDCGSWGKLDRMDMTTEQADLPWDQILNLMNRTPVVRRLAVSTFPDLIVPQVARLCPHIKELIVKIPEGGSRVSLSAVTNAYPGLEVLEITAARSFGDLVSNRGTAFLLEHAKQLRRLVFRNVANIVDFANDQGVPVVSTSLREVTIGACAIPNLASITDACPSLEQLHLRDLDTNSFPTIDGLDGVIPSCECLILENCSNVRNINFIPPEGETLCVKKLCLLGCSNLEELNVNSSALASLEVEVCPLLTNVAVRNTVIEELDLSNGVSRLEYLNLDGRHFKSLNVSHCNLRDSGVQISGPLQSLNLFESGLSVNQIESMVAQLSRTSNLQCLEIGKFSSRMLSLNSNTLETLIVRDASSVASIDVFLPKLNTFIFRKGGRELDIDEVLRNLPCLQHLELTDMISFHGDCRRIWTSNCQLRTLMVRRCQLNSFWMHDIPTIESLTLESCNKLRSVSIIGCTNLVQLSTNWSDVRQLVIRNTNSLQTLSTVNCRFDLIEVSSTSLLQLHELCASLASDSTFVLRCPQLEFLHLDRCTGVNTEILTRVLQGCQFLSTLKLFGCKNVSSVMIPPCVQQLDIRGMRQLKEIHFAENHTSLEALHLYDTCLTHDALKSLMLNFRHTLKSLSLGGCTNEIIALCVDMPVLTEFNLERCTHLSTLQMNCTNLSSVRILGCPHLASLLVKLSNLSTISRLSEPLFPVQSLTLVTERCPAAELLQTGFPNLQTLSLYVEYDHISIPYISNLVDCCLTIRKLQVSEECFGSLWGSKTKDKKMVVARKVLTGKGISSQSFVDIRHSTSGDTFRVNLQLHRSVSDLKKAIELRTGIPEYAQQLVFRSRKIESSTLLETLQISPNETMYLMGPHPKKAKDQISPLVIVEATQLPCI
eukprot:m.116634 g.116634  ORF g.116634 m.116634 type:complete len:928 (-) comp14236_c0_seq8:2444-5227(-)